MRLCNLLFSIVHLLVVCLVFGLGALFVSLSYEPLLREALAEVVRKDAALFSTLGFGLFIVGFLLLIAFWAMHRRRYLTIEMNHNKARIDESIVKDYVSDFWRTQFNMPVQDVVFHSGQKLEVIAPLPEVEEETLKRVEGELSVLLARRLGYERDFQLTVVES